MAEKVCIITGASRGIGLATALRFAKNGYAIAALARGESDLNDAARQIRDSGGACEPIVADVGLEGDATRAIDTALDKLGRIDVLINNAGAAPPSPVVEMATGDFDRAVSANIASVFYMTRAAWPALVKQGGGVIVNVSSRASVDPFPGLAVYGACKAWVNLFTQATAGEGKPHGIRVFAVAPGGVETGMFRELFPDYPAENVLQPDDVAKVIEAVCDPRMNYTSGQTVFVNK
jgi:3-oxoacyl-[acyl-carrier protein] reductase